MIEISTYISDAAKALVNKGSDLPAVIAEAPGFVVAKGDDKTVQAFGAFKVDNVSYKIGTLKTPS